MYILHYAPDNASLIVRLVLEELGTPYRTALVDRKRRQQDSAAYRALNPVGVIPVLETPEGPISETGAILLWLAETHGALAPAPGDPGRGVFLKWLFFTANTLHADLRLVFYPAQYAGDDETVQRRLYDAVTTRMRRHFALMNDLAGQGTGWFAAAQPSVLDYYVATTMRWARLYGAFGAAWFEPADYPSLMTMARGLETRPATRAAIEAEGLGETPFSAPHPCDPPEGSAV